MTPAPMLTGTRVILRAPRESDKADRLACPRSAEAVRMYGGDYFVQEGVARETRLVAGHWHNDVIMRLLENEYRAVSSDWNLPPPEEN
jgi:hypothetical protein